MNSIVEPGAPSVCVTNGADAPARFLRNELFVRIFEARFLAVLRAHLVSARDRPQPAHELRCSIPTNPFFHFPRDLRGLARARVKRTAAVRGNGGRPSI